MHFINTENEKYYVLIMINNNIDLNLVNNTVQVMGIFSSKEDAQIKINSLPPQVSSNLNPKYIIQGPFTLDRPTSNIVRPNPRPNPRPDPIPNPRPNPRPNPDIFNPDIFKHSGHCSSKYFSSRYFPQ